MNVCSLGVSLKAKQNGSMAHSLHHRTWKQAQDDNSDVFGQDDESSRTPRAIVLHANTPPPANGKAAIVSFTDVASIHVTSASREIALDGQTVVFYDMLTRTNSHRWSVRKRFSDFFEFSSICEKQLRVKDKNFLDLPTFPTRLHIGRQNNEFVDRRRTALETYLRELLRRLTAAECRMRQVFSGAEAQTDLLKEQQIRALLHHFLSFVRVDSRSLPINQEINPLANDFNLFPTGANRTVSRLDFSRMAQPPQALSRRESMLRQESPADTSRTEWPCDVMDSQQHQFDSMTPCARVVQRDDAYIVMLHVPGVSMKEIYVTPIEGSVLPHGMGEASHSASAVDVASAEDSARRSSVSDAVKAVLIGGRWSLALMPANAAQMLTAMIEGLAQQRNAKRQLSCSSSGFVSEELIHDSLPTGPFEITVDVPLCFDVCQYVTDYSDGVLTIMWATRL